MKKQTFMSKKYYSMLAGGTITGILVSLLMISDSVIAGIWLGGRAVAGINLIMPVYSLTAFLGMMVSLGIPILYSKEIGSFHKEEADRYFGLGLTLTAGIGILMFAVLCAVGDSYIHFYQASPEIAAEASAYYFWMRVVILLMPLSTYLCEMVFADGDEGLATAAGIAEAAGKILFSVVLCGSMGIAGLSLGTVIGTVASLAVCLVHFFRKQNSLKPNLCFSVRKMLTVVRYSLVDASTYLFLAAFTAFMNKYIIVHFGAGMIGMVSVIAFLRELQLVFDGVGEAITPIISIYLSENCFDGVRKIWKHAEKTALFEGVVTAGILAAAASAVPGLLGFSDPELIRTAAVGLRILAVSLPFISILYLLTSYYLLLDRIALGVLICAMRDLVLAVPAAVVLGNLFGIDGVFAGVAGSAAAAYLASRLYVVLRHGKANWPLILKEREERIRTKLVEFDVKPGEIVKTRDEIEALLLNGSFSRKSVMNAMLIFEEFFMTVYDKNPGRDVCAECTIVLEPDRIKMIGRDDGRIMDFSEADLKLDSLRSYILTRLASRKNISTGYLMSISFNTNMLELLMQKEESSGLSGQKEAENV